MNFAIVVGRFYEDLAERLVAGAQSVFEGQADVFDEMASADAAGLFRFLQRHGVIAGDPGAAPALQCEGTDLEATDIVRAPKAGIIAYKVALGAEVKKGDVVAEIVDPLADDAGKARQPVRAVNDGLVLSRCLRKTSFCACRSALR